MNLTMLHIPLVDLACIQSNKRKEYSSFYSFYDELVQLSLQKKHIHRCEPHSKIILDCLTLQKNHDRSAMPIRYLFALHSDQYAIYCQI